jgi:hypothetical protein
MRVAITVIANTTYREGLFIWTKRYFTTLGYTNSDTLGTLLMEKEAAKHLFMQQSRE